MLGSTFTCVLMMATSAISPAAHSLTVWIPEDIIFACVLSARKTELVLILPRANFSKPKSTPALSTGSSAPNQISLNIPLLQQAFGTFPIKSSQVAALIGAYMSANPMEASMWSVSNAFVKLIKNSPEDINDILKLRWWCRYVKVISNLQESLASLLDAEVAATNGSGGSVVNSFYLPISLTSLTLDASSAMLSGHIQHQRHGTTMKQLRVRCCFI